MEMETHFGERQKRRDPFYEPPLHKAFYHPSPSKDVPENLKAVLNGGCSTPNQADLPAADFLQETNTFTQRALPTGTSPDDVSSKFEESWPGSEHPSTIDFEFPPDDLTLRSQNTATRWQQDTSPMKPISQLISEYKSSRPSSLRTLSDAKGTLETSKLSQGSDAMLNGGSTLSKYIERFRHGAPCSRQERKQKQITDPADFWWVSSSPPAPRSSSTPRSETDGSVREDRKVRGPEKFQSRRKESTSSVSILSKPSSRSEVVFDSDTQKIMERTERLLERSESSLNSSNPVVSTVGLGSFRSSTTVDETPYLPTFVHQRDKENIRDLMQGSHCPATREDDILYQWRRQRHMDKIRHKVGTMVHSGGLASMKVIDDVETRLANIRQKVSSQRVMTDSCSQERAPQAPAPMPSENEMAKVEKTIEKTDASCQTNKSVDKQVGPSSPNRATLLTAFHMGQGQLEAPPGGVEPGPHLHLSCDILPCPHDHSGVIPTQHPEPARRDHSHSKHTKREKMSNKINPVVSESSGPESDFESYKREHMARVAQELEDVQLGAEETDLETLNQKQRSSSQRKKDISSRTRQREEREKRQREGRRESKERVQSEGHKTLEKKQQKELNSHDVGKSRPKKTHSVSSSESDKQVAGQDEGVQQGQIKEFPTQDGSHERSRSRGEFQGIQQRAKPVMYDLQGQEVRGQGRGLSVLDSISDSSFHEGATPLYHSSPRSRRAELTPTIQQVVTEHLFLESENEVEISEDPTKDNAGEKTGEKDEKIYPISQGEGFESDEEEFADDDILVNMRGRRAHYAWRLQVIDQLLAVTEN